MKRPPTLLYALSLLLALATLLLSLNPVAHADDPTGDGTSQHDRVVEDALTVSRTNWTAPPTKSVRATLNHPPLKARAFFTLGHATPRSIGAIAAPMSRRSNISCATTATAPARSTAFSAAVPIRRCVPSRARRG